MRINVDIAELQALAELRRSTSFSEAADHLALTPSALGRRIARLEDAIGGMLVQRTTRSMSLTKLGSALSARVDDLLVDLDRCLRDASDVAAGRTGMISVGCMATLAQSLLPRVAAHFRARFPHVRLSIRDGHAAEVQRQVLDGAVEFAVAVDCQPSEDLVVVDLATDRYCLVCPRSHPLASRSVMTWSELSSERVLSMSPNSAMRRQVDAALDRASIGRPWFDEVDSLSALLGHVSMAGALAVLPSLALSQESGYAVIELTEPTVGRTVSLLRRRDFLLSVPAEHLWELVSNSLVAPHDPTQQGADAEQGKVIKQATA